MGWAPVFLGMCLYLLPTIPNPTKFNTINTAAQKASNTIEEHARTNKIIYKNLVKCYTVQSFYQMTRETGAIMTGTTTIHVSLGQISDTSMLHGTDLVPYQPFPPTTSTTRSKQSWHKIKIATPPVSLCQFVETLTT